MSPEIHYVFVLLSKPPDPMYCHHNTIRPFCYKYWLLTVRGGGANLQPQSVYLTQPTPPFPCGLVYAWKMAEIKSLGYLVLPCLGSYLLTNQMPDHKLLLMPFRSRAGSSLVIVLILPWAKPVGWSNQPKTSSFRLAISALQFDWPGGRMDQVPERFKLWRKGRNRWDASPCKM